MPIIGITITKEAAFRESVQPFNNTYYYNNGIGGVPDGPGALALIDELVAIEKTLHSSVVTFTFGRCWHQTLLQITTQMIEQKALGGVGSASTFAGQDRERAYLFRWPAGLDSRGNPVYLRKWYHTMGNFPGAPASASIHEQIAGFSQASRDAAEANVQDVATLSSAGGGWNLCAKSGRGLSAGTMPQMHQFLEHHQLGDQWRGD